MILLRPSGMRVRYETQLCDRHGRIERVLQRGRNTITNWGMDTLASLPVTTLINYLNLSSASDARKRQLAGGNNLTITYTSETNITVVADTSFFVSADAGRTLVVPSVPELKITAFTDVTHVTCAAPSGFWLEGFTPPGSPTVYSTAAVYYTSLNTLAAHFTKFNTLDTGGSTEATDNSNSRFVHTRIFLSGIVSGSNWTVNQLGWSDGNASNNCFGVANLAGADTIVIGKRYRVVLTVDSNYVPMNLTGVAVNWGATIGSYTMDIRQENIGRDSGGSGPEGSFLQPHCISNGAGVFQSGFWTAAHALVSTYWQGQSGGTAPAAMNTAGLVAVTKSSYTNGEFTLTKNIRWPDTTVITNATALGCAQGGSVPMLTLRPQSGTVNKPAGFACDATFRLFWTRDLPI